MYVLEIVGSDFGVGMEEGARRMSWRYGRMLGAVDEYCRVRQLREMGFRFPLCGDCFPRERHFHRHLERGCSGMTVSPTASESGDGRSRSRDRRRARARRVDSDEDSRGQQSTLTEHRGSGRESGAT